MEISEPLDRGDELLEVNKEPVKDKKLANIYQLILCKVPAQVELKIKKMQHDIGGCNAIDIKKNYEK